MPAEITAQKEIIATKEAFMEKLNNHIDKNTTLDCSNYQFAFSDFSGLNLQGCQFWREEELLSSDDHADNAAPTAGSTSAFSKNSFVEILENKTRNIRATFSKKPDFSGTKLTRDMFWPSEKRGVAPIGNYFPAGYCNDGGLFNKVDIEECATNLRNYDGLDRAQICAVTEHMKIDVLEATKSHSVTVLMNTNNSEIKRVSSTLHAGNTHSVLNIENIFSDGEKSPNTIRSDELHQFLEALQAERATTNPIGKELTATIYCIQMPMTLRKHYVQVQIYKNKHGEISARIVDSTGNPIGLSKAAKAIHQILIDNKKMLEILLGVNLNVNIAEKVSIVHTNVQSSMPGSNSDKGCGVYEMAGTLATTREVLLNGPKFLHDDKEVKTLIAAEHVAAKESSTYLQDNCDPNCVVKKVPKVKTTSVLLDEKIAEMNGVNLAAAVEAALNAYQSCVRGWGLFHSQGSAYVAVNLAKLTAAKNDSVQYASIARKITKEILSDGLMRKKNSILGGDSGDTGALKVVNTRMMILLEAFKSFELIDSKLDVNKSNRVIMFNDLFNKSAESVAVSQPSN
ncbi:MAG: hypothetical protein NTZ67_02155 [Gammaproteobacteria bacterium]|nr:hypothetical protein [Gammaproteobacteria bacterium]